MANETVRLAEYAAGLRYEDLPPNVVQRAKDCITDTVAVIVLGNGLPWSRIIAAYAQRIGAGGRSRILGADGPTVARAGGGAGQRHAGARFRIRQPDQAGCRRASRRHVAAAGPRRGAGARQQRARADHRRGGRVRGDVSHRPRHETQQRAARLSCARHHRPVRRGGGGGRSAGAGCAAHDQRARHRRFAGRRADGVRAFRHRRDGEAAASRPRGGERRDGRQPGRRRLHRPAQRDRRRGRIPEGVLHGMGHGRPDARARQRVRHAEPVPEAISRAHDRADRGAGGAGVAGGTWFRRRGGGRG